MEDGIDTNVANGTGRTADMTNQEITVKQVDYAGNEAAQRTLERSLNQSRGDDASARDTSATVMAAAHDLAAQARFTNLSNRGAGE